MDDFHNIYLQSLFSNTFTKKQKEMKNVTILLKYRDRKQIIFVWTYFEIFLHVLYKWCMACK